MVAETASEWWCFPARSWEERPAGTTEDPSGKVRRCLRPLLSARLFFLPRPAGMVPNIYTNVQRIEHITCGKKNLLLDSFPPPFAPAET